MTNLWVVIPTYNEQANLAELVTHLFELDLPLKVLIVDDNSPDGTGVLADELARAYKEKLFVLHRSGKMGLGSAYRQGFSLAIARGAEVVAEMDADFSHLPQDLPRLWQKILDGADVAVGSRRVKGGRVVGWGAWRHFTSWGANSASRLILGLKTQDVTAGFRMYKVKSLEKISWRTITSNGYAWQEEILFLLEKSGAGVIEVSVVFNDREKGKSKLRFKDILEFFYTIIRLAKIK